MKGHNYGLCRKCGKDHGSAPNKGRHFTAEHKRNLSIGIKNSKKFQEGRRKAKKVRYWAGHNYGPEICRKCGKIHKHPWKGKHHSEKTRRKMSLSQKGRIISLKQRLKQSKTLRQSKKSREMYAKKREKAIEKCKVALRKAYNIPEEASFIPATMREHKFARKVLIEGKRAPGLVSGWSGDAHDLDKKKAVNFNENNDREKLNVKRRKSDYFQHLLLSSLWSPIMD